ncbi:MAG: DUF1573 domain-containing protein [Candidatus Paceibacterota bacterium]
MRKYKNIIYTSITIAAILVVLVIVFQPTESGQLGPVSQNDSVALTAEESLFDFGNISMAEGMVTHDFKIQNLDTEPVMISKIYTSCMCTSAELVTDSGSKGPFGMAGHGFLPAVNELVGVNEDATIRVTFDPAAHGPAGIGRADRVVYVEQKSGAKLNLRFTAFITP